MLKQLGLAFETVPSSVTEPAFTGKNPVQYARALAKAKASEIAEKYPDSIILGADTIVLINDQVLGKPLDEHHAFVMLRSLSGRYHHVITAFSLHHKNLQIAKDYHIRTQVHFRELLEEEIQYYINTGDPFDKAGAYGIQDYSGVFVDSIKGCFYNVVGLPLSAFYSRLTHLLREFDLKIQS